MIIELDKIDEPYTRTLYIYKVYGHPLVAKITFAINQKKTTPT